MNFSTQFIRKICYIGLMIPLLFVLSFVGRPSTRDDSDAISDEGGVLSQLRSEYELSAASLSEIDPASESMKLGSLGLRGLAVNMLWLQAIEAKEKKEWDNMATTLDTLVKLQPNFIKVWEYQAHNLSYNVSVEFDDYENRYTWVKRGIEFLTQGIPVNRKDHRILDNLGFFSGNKFGTSDERVLYRKLFTNDDEFHDKMAEYVVKSNLRPIDRGDFGPDNWMLAHEWYRLSEEMVEKPEVRLRRKPFLFYQFKPAQLRNMMLSLYEEEFVNREASEILWRRAHDEWMDYGNRTIMVRDGIEYSMEMRNIDLNELRKKRALLDEIVPGVRDQLTAQIREDARATIPDEVLALLKKNPDEYTDEELYQVRNAEQFLYRLDDQIDRKIAAQAPPDKKIRALELASEIERIIGLMRRVESDRNTINYEHWRDRTQVEATLPAIRARQAEFEASELSRRSIFDSYSRVDPITKERVEQPGAIQAYEQSFALWAGVLEDYPLLKVGPLMDDIIGKMYEYQKIRRTAGLLPWIPNHPLQQIIDERATRGEADELPTTMEVIEMYEDASQVGDRTFGLPRRPDIEFSLDQ